MSSTPEPQGPWDPHTIQKVELRDRLEIQKAHDTLTAIILGEVELDLDSENIAKIRSACHVLCWVLKHEYNQEFPILLKALQDEIKRRGYTITTIGN